MSEKTCPKCLRLVKYTDFLGKETCYKCTLEQKRAAIKSVKIEKSCLICAATLPSHRWRFCSEYCSDINDQKKNESYHWYLRINAPSSRWS